MNAIRRIVIFAALLALLAGLPAAAAEPEDAAPALEQLMEQFRADYGLDEENFSICYRDTVTGEEYRYNDTKFMVAASTFKLPLNLYYYELEQEGRLSPDDCVGGVRLADAHYQTLVWSNNDIAISMLYRLGNFRTYKDLMRKYFTMDESQITSAYYADNNYCTAMMLDALQYLYARQDQFGELLGYMKEAQPEQYFARYVTDYEVAHKYGYFADEDKGVTAVNDVGIVFTPQPFLLAVYTANAPGGEEVVSRACELLTDYNVRQYAQAQAAMAQAEPDEPDELGAPAAPAEPHDPAEAAGPAEPAKPGEPGEPAGPTPEETLRDNLWWMVLIAAVIFLIADLGVLFLMRRGGPERWTECWEKRRKAPRKRAKSGRKPSDSGK